MDKPKKRHLPRSTKAPRPGEIARAGGCTLDFVPSRRLANHQSSPGTHAPRQVSPLVPPTSRSTLPDRSLDWHLASCSRTCSSGTSRCTASANGRHGSTLKHLGSPPTNCRRSTTTASAGVSITCLEPTSPQWSWHWRPMSSKSSKSTSTSCTMTPPRSRSTVNMPMPLGNESAASIRGWRSRRGSNKDHRPDLKQLLFILTVARDGRSPLSTVASGNVVDDKTHIATSGPPLSPG